MALRSMPKATYRKAIFKVRDIGNTVRYGKGAPSAGDRIWIYPKDVSLEVAGLYRHQTGLVIDWSIVGNKKISKVEDGFKYRACYERWVNGASWESTGIHEFMLSLISQRGAPVDGCRSLEEIIARYKKLDKLFFEMEKGSSFMTRDDIRGVSSGKEFGGVYVHLDEDGSLIFGGGGYHRLAIAKILSVPVIPAQIGVVHKNQIFHFKELKFQRS
jgi:hypothetical protein